MIRFLQPDWLWLLALLPLALLWHGRRGAVEAVEYSDVALARDVARATRSRTGRWVWLLPILASAFMIVGLARPQWGHGITTITANGIDIMLGLDVSGSMQALDFKVAGQPVNRVQIVKSVVSKFIDERPNDRIGLIAFAGAPYLVSPLTLDHDWLQQNLDRVQTGGVDDGTAIGSAIASGVNRLRDHARKIQGHDPAHRRREQHRQDLAHGRRRSRQGVGREDLHHRASACAARRPYRSRTNSAIRSLVMAKVDVDEPTLQNIATLTGGAFYRATDTDSLRHIYEQINQLETLGSDREEVRALSGAVCLGVDSGARRCWVSASAWSRPVFGGCHDLCPATLVAGRPGRLRGGSLWAWRRYDARQHAALAQFVARTCARR